MMTAAKKQGGADLQHDIVEALRGELQEYGALLALFDDQQRAILAREADRVLEIGEAIEAQIDLTHRRRKQREGFVQAIAKASGKAGERALGKLLDIFPAPSRVLVEALMDEVNRLIAQVRRRSKQNQMLLARHVEVTQQILQRANPESVGATYSAQGKLKLKAAAPSRRLVDRG